MARIQMLFIKCINVWGLVVSTYGFHNFSNGVTNHIWCVTAHICSSALTQEVIYQQYTSLSNNQLYGQKQNGYWKRQVCNRINYLI